MPLRTILITATRSGTASTVIIRRGASGTGTGDGTSDHGALTGLADDDHTQYLNNARGDARYASTAALEGKASLTGANNFTGTQSFAQPVYLSGAVLGFVTTPIAGAYNGPGTGLTGTAANLSVGTASTAAYATTAGTANALAGILPITSGGTGANNLSALQPAITSANASVVRTALGLGVEQSPTFAGVTATSNLTISATSSNQASPRTVGITNLTAGTAARYTFGDPLNSIQASNGGRLQLQSYWGVEINGSRQSLITLGFAPGAASDASLRVVGTVAAAPVITVIGAASQSGNLIEWRSSAGTVLGSVSGSGNLANTGSIESTTATAGLILKSPDGTRYRVTIENDGTLTRTAL